MITVIRRHFKGVLYKSILWITIFALAGFFSLPIFFKQMGGAGESWAIRVNKQDISIAEFSREVMEKREWIAQQRAQYGEYADFLFASMGLKLDPQSLATEVLVRETVLQQAAQSIGLYLHPDYIARQLQDPSVIMQELSNIIPPYVVDKTGINMVMLKQFLNNKKISVSDFEAKLERILASRILLEIVAYATYIPAQEVKQQYIARHVGKKFSILSFSLDSLLQEEQKQPVTDQTLQAFFDECLSVSKQQFRNDCYFVPEKRTGFVWKFNPSNYGIVISDHDIETYYDKHKAEFISEPTRLQVRHILIKVTDESQRAHAQQKAESLYQELVQNPNLFAQKAQELSDDTTTTKQGGQLPWFARGEQDPALERAAFLLKEDGAISTVIPTNSGYEILQRTHKKMQAYKPLADVRLSIKELLTLQQFSAVFQKDAQAYITNNEEFNGWGVAKKAHKEALKDLEFESSDLANTLFKLKKDEKSFYVKNNEGFVVELTDIKERYLPSFDSIKSRVKKDFYQEKAQDKMNILLDRIMQETKQAPLAKIKNNYSGAKWEETSWIKPDATDTIKALEKRGLPIQTMLQIENVNTAMTHSTESTGYVIQLEGIDEADLKEFDSKKLEVKQQLSNDRARLQIEGFVASLYRNATIETNNSTLNLQNNIRYEK